MKTLNLSFCAIKRAGRLARVLSVCALQACGANADVSIQALTQGMTVEEALAVCQDSRGNRVPNTTCDAAGGLCRDGNGNVIEGVCVEVPDTGGEGSETAFGYSAALGTCFRDVQIEGVQRKIARWGWTNGAMSADSMEMDLYAGAAHCDLDKGTHVGTATVSYSGSEATITYSMAAGFALKEVHAYAGSSPLPLTKRGRPTVAPGRFPAKSEDIPNASSHTVTVSSLSGPIHVIAHAVVSGSFGDGDDDPERDDEQGGSGSEGEGGAGDPRPTDEPVQ